MAATDKKELNDDPFVASANAPLKNLNEYIPGVLTWVYNRLSSDASRAYREWYGLGVTDWRVLAYLGVNRDGTAANISRIINLDKAATSRSIAFLKANGLVNTRQLPGRNVELTLTAEGDRKFQEISVHALDREEALLSGFSSGERLMLKEMLHRMLSNMDQVSRVLPRGHGEAGANGSRD